MTRLLSQAVGTGVKTQLDDTSAVTPSCHPLGADNSRPSRATDTYISSKADLGWRLGERVNKKVGHIP